jgi:hypothetical protein
MNSALGRLQARLHNRSYEWMAVGLGVLLSVWLTWQSDVPNTDGILYLQSAEAFARGDCAAAVALYNWPFYPWLIAAVHKISGLDFEYAAYVINTLLYGLTLYAYIALVRLLGGGRSTLIAALLLILLMPAINSYRSYIIRDAGYWAFYLAALWAFVIFLRRPDIKSALIWSVVCVVATLFRIEGSVVWALLPLYLWMRTEYSWAQRARHWLTANAFLLVGVVAISAWAVITRPSFMGRLREPLRWVGIFGHAVSDGLDGRAQALSHAVLNQFSDYLALPAIIGILFLIVAARIVNGLGLLHGGLAIYGVCRTEVMPKGARPLLLWAAFIQLLILFVFATHQFFLTGRYAIPLALTLVLFAPFGLAQVHAYWQRAHSNKAKLLKSAIFLLLLIAAVQSLWSFGASKAYLREAGVWIRAQTPPQSRLFTNNEVVAYYSRRKVDERHGEFTEEALDKVLSSDDWRANYDYLAIMVQRHNEKRAKAILQKMGVAPIATIANERGAQVLVFSARSAAESVPSRD